VDTERKLVAVDDEVTGKEAAERLADALMAYGGPAEFLWGFLQALADGRTDEAISCLDADYVSLNPAIVADPEATGLGLLAGPGWGPFGTPEVLENGDLVVAWVESEPEESKFVRAVTGMRGVEFHVHYRDQRWSVVRIIRHGC